MSGMKTVVIALVLTAPAAFGATHTWIAKHAGVWSDTANWDGGVPLAGDDVVLTSSSTNDLPPGLELHSIRIIGGTVIFGNEIVLGAGGFNDSTHFFVPIARDQAMFSKITLASSQTWVDDGNPPETTMIGPTNLNGATLTLVNTQFIIQSISGSGAIVMTSGFDTIEASTFTGPITVNGGWLDFTGRSLGALTVKPGGTFIVADNPLTSGSIAFDAASGQTAGFRVFARFLTLPTIHVTGSVALQNAALDLSISYEGLPAGTPVPLINNDDFDPVAGTFLGLAEGAIINNGHGQSFRISYIGGDGNDVTLTMLASPANSTTTSVKASANPSASGQTVMLTAMVTGAQAQSDVGFYDGGVLLGTSALDGSGRATLAAALPAGLHVVTAAYSGTQTIATSQGTLKLTVEQPRLRAVRRR
jgi:autotransporter-associated beta strand protein